MIVVNRQIYATSSGAERRGRNHIQRKPTTSLRSKKLDLRLDLYAAKLLNLVITLSIIHFVTQG
jgi:hypothetical protein